MNKQQAKALKALPLSKSNIAAAETDKIANAIIEISQAMKGINAGKLKQRAIIILIHDLTGVPFGEIKKVLDACSELSKEFTNESDNLSPI
jgi:hypothetical protein